MIATNPLHVTLGSGDDNALWGIYSRIGYHPQLSPPVFNCHLPISHPLNAIQPVRSSIRYFYPSLWIDE
jgi:hypothetical protein